MSDITLLDLKREPCPELTGKSLLDQAAQRFQMFAGEPREVKLRFHRSLVNAVIDRFGTDTMLIPDGDAHFVFTVRVAVSPMFLSWLIGFGDKARVIHPADVAERCKALCLEALSQYE